MPAMTTSEWRDFISSGTRNGKLATTRRDGRPTVVPIWFLLDGNDVVFLTGEATVKARALARSGWASMCVDDEQPPYAFVTIGGAATLSDCLEDMLPWSIRIAERYVGDEKAEQIGRQFAVPGELLVRLRVETVFAVTNVLLG